MSISIRQTGSTLLISLIMLVLLTLFVLSAINLTNVNLRVSGNMQVQEEAEAAAQQAIDEVLKRPLVVTVTTEVVTPVAIGNSTYTPVVTKQCIDSVVSKDTDPSNLVYDSVWDIRAEITDARTGANVVLHQGVAWAGGGVCP